MAVQVTIHRGTHQIGGCCTEICTDRARIIIDLGDELPEPGKPSKPLELDGVTQGEADCDGVFFTHYHGDHIGQYGRILPGIPLYMGKTAKDIFALYQQRIARHSLAGPDGLLKLRKAFPLQDREAVQVGDITVVPLAVDHSAYDAYMFLILAGDKRILHTGDFRLHGYRGGGVLTALRDYVRTVDIVITEGTALSRPEGRVLTEQDVYRRAKGYMAKYKHTFVLCSSTNIDRLRSFYNAAKRTGRMFVCNGYIRSVLDLFSYDRDIWTDRRGYPRAKVYGKNLDGPMEKHGSCMIVRACEADRRLMDRFPAQDSLLIYSMWSGYLDRQPELQRFVADRRMIHLHASGHGSASQIKRVCDLVRPRYGIIPIHTDAPEKLDEVCPDWPVIHLEDGEGFVLGAEEDRG